MLQIFKIEGQKKLESSFEGVSSTTVILVPAHVERGSAQQSMCWKRGHRPHVVASKLSPAVGEALLADASQSEGRGLRERARPL